MVGDCGLRYCRMLGGVFVGEYVNNVLPVGVDNLETLRDQCVIAVNQDAEGNLSALCGSDGQGELEGDSSAMRALEQAPPRAHLMVQEVVVSAEAQMLIDQLARERDSQQSDGYIAAGRLIALAMLVGLAISIGHWWGHVREAAFVEAARQYREIDSGSPSLVQVDVADVAASPSHAVSTAHVIAVSGLTVALSFIAWAVAVWGSLGMAGFAALLLITASVMAIGISLERSLAVEKSIRRPDIREKA